MKRVTRYLLIVAGTVCVALGVIGIFVPIMPTTPFLLLAAACYARSSERFYQWVLTNRWFGEYVRNYREGKGIPFMHKILTLASLWLTIGYAVMFVVSPWWAKLILFATATGVTIHLVKIKNFVPENKAAR